MPLYCIPVPGESEWVHETCVRLANRASNSNASDITRSTAAVETTLEQYPSGPAASSMLGKRTRAEQLDCVAGGSLSDSEHSSEGAAASMITEQPEKRPRLDNEQGASAEPAVHTDPGLPLPGMSGSACIVKVYGASDDSVFRLNRVFEFIGILYRDTTPTPAEYVERESSIQDVLALTRASHTVTMRSISKATMRQCLDRCLTLHGCMLWHTAPLVATAIRSAAP